MSVLVGADRYPNAPLGLPGVTALQRRLYIGLFDCDAFYAAVEALRKPHLKGKPVAIVDATTKSKVIARSYEMRHYGVKVSMSVREARRRCPDGYFLDPDFDYYSKMSGAVMDVLDGFSTRVENYSIDEFFMELPGLEDRDSLERRGRMIRDAVLRETGISGSIGIASTRHLAKMASEVHKPFGILVLPDRAAQREFLAGAKVTDIPFIASERGKMLARHGITTALQFSDADPVWVRWLLTVEGERLWFEMNGYRAAEVTSTSMIPKVVSRGGTFGGPVDSWFELYGWTARRLEKIAAELQTTKLRAGRLTLQVSGHRGEQTAQFGFPAPTWYFEELIAPVADYLEREFSKLTPATHLWIEADRLTFNQFSRTIESEADAARLETLAKLKREAQEMFGPDAIRSGATLGIPHIYGDPSQRRTLADTRYDLKGRRRTLF